MLIIFFQVLVSLALIKLHFYLIHTLSLGICALFLKRLGTYPSGRCILCDSYQLPSCIYRNAFFGGTLISGVPVFSILLILLLVFSVAYFLYGFPLLPEILVCSLTVNLGHVV